MKKTLRDEDPERRFNLLNKNHSFDESVLSFGCLFLLRFTSLSVSFSYMAFKTYIEVCLLLE